MQELGVKTRQSQIILSSSFQFIYNNRNEFNRSVLASQKSLIQKQTCKRIPEEVTNYVIATSYYQMAWSFKCCDQSPNVRAVLSSIFAQKILYPMIENNKQAKLHFGRSKETVHNIVSTVDLQFMASNEAFNSDDYDEVIGEDIDPLQFHTCEPVFITIKLMVKSATNMLNQFLHQQVPQRTILLLFLLNQIRNKMTHSKPYSPLFIFISIVPN